jgi:hypothetical protein
MGGGRFHQPFFLVQAKLWSWRQNNVQDGRQPFSLDGHVTDDLFGAKTQSFTLNFLLGSWFMQTTSFSY